MGGHGRKYGFIYINQSKFKYFFFDVAHCRLFGWFCLSMKVLLTANQEAIFFLFTYRISVPKHHQLPPSQCSHSVLERPVMNSDEDCKSIHWNGNQQRCCTFTTHFLFHSLFLIPRQVLALKSSTKDFIPFLSSLSSIFVCSILLCVRKIKSCSWLDLGGELVPREEACLRSTGDSCWSTGGHLLSPTNVL